MSPEVDRPVQWVEGGSVVVSFLGMENERGAGLDEALAGPVFFVVRGRTCPIPQGHHQSEC